jgi:hypothetical protein
MRLSDLQFLIDELTTNDPDFDPEIMIWDQNWECPIDTKGMIYNEHEDLIIIETDMNGT